MTLSPGVGRTRVIRRLPALTEIVPVPANFPPAEDRVSDLAGRLRGIASRARRQQWVAFYAMRDVARHFRGSGPTVARAYKVLADEGLLVRVRSSQTLLRPVKLHTRRPVRAIVAVPVWIQSLSLFRDWREFFIGLQEELHYHQLVVDFLFYPLGEVTPADFAERIIAHHPNVLFWPEPHKSFRQTMEMVADQGVQVTSLTYQMTRFPGFQYRICWRRALGAVLDDWKTHGVRSVVLAGEYSPATAAIDHQLLAAAGLAYSHVDLSRQPLAKWLASLPSPRTTGVLLNQSPEFARLCIVSPDDVQLMCRRLRVMAGTRLPVASSLLRDARVEVVEFDWPAIAKRVAHDLVAGLPRRTEAARLFEAEARFRVPASQHVVTDFAREARADWT